MSIQFYSNIFLPLLRGLLETAVWSLSGLWSTEVVPNFFCPKVYFSSSHHSEIYQSSVKSTPQTHKHRIQPVVKNSTKLFLAVTQPLDLKWHSTKSSSLKQTHTRTHHNLFENQTEK